MELAIIHAEARQNCCRGFAAEIPQVEQYLLTVEAVKLAMQGRIARYIAFSEMMREKWLCS